MFSEAEWKRFCRAGSAGNQPPMPLGGGISNSIKNPWIRAVKIGGFFRWGGPRRYAKFGWLILSGGRVVMGEGFGRHGWVRLVVRGGRHFCQVYLGKYIGIVG